MIFKKFYNYLYLYNNFILSHSAPPQKKKKKKKKSLNWNPYQIPNYNYPHEIKKLINKINSPNSLSYTLTFFFVPLRFHLSFSSCIFVALRSLFFFFVFATPKKKKKKILRSCEILRTCELVPQFVQTLKKLSILLFFVTFQSFPPNLCSLQNNQKNRRSWVIFVCCTSDRLCSRLYFPRFDSLWFFFLISSISIHSPSNLGFKNHCNFPPNSEFWVNYTIALAVTT